MEALKSYLLTAMLASLVASLILRISDSRYRAYLRYVAGLALLVLLTVPLTSLAEELAEELSALESYQQEQESEPQEEIMGEIGRTMSQQIGDLVAHRYGLSRESVAVKLTLDLSDLSAITIYQVDLTIRSECNAGEIQRYLSESLDCPVAVTIVSEGDSE